MKSEHAAVIKVKECPVCGAMNRVRYGFNEVIVDGACGFCGSMVRWKRKVGHRERSLVYKIPDIV